MKHAKITPKLGAFQCLKCKEIVTIEDEKAAPRRALGRLPAARSDVVELHGPDALAGTEGLLGAGCCSGGGCGEGWCGVVGGSG
jgi:hypothetical protein